MHRSGTSAVARALNLLGAYIGRPDQLMPSGTDNPDGFWEHIEIFYFHERLLKYFSRSWDTISPMPREWWKEPGLKIYRQQLIDCIKREFAGQSVWLWKDPRTSIFLPLWEDVLDELDMEVCYLYCLRNPLDVAASLKKRNGFSKSRSFALWLFYSLSAFHWTHGASRVIVQYDRLLEDWEGSLRTISGAFDLPWPEDDHGLRREMADFLKLDSRHSQTDSKLLSSDKDVPASVVTLYRLLKNAEENRSLLDSKQFEETLSELFVEYSPANMTGGTTGLSSVKKLTLDPITPLHFNLFENPHVSIIIPVWNHWRYTYRCLDSILKNTDEVSYEVIVVDNGSTDETTEVLKKIENLRILRHETNLGYVKACNEGAGMARGAYLLFLNNDTEPQARWLENLLAAADMDSLIGAVGAKLVYPDGKLQEAGGMIFSDGRGWNFGNGDDPEKEIYNQICEVDYCSGACLLVRRSLFNALGGFDERYSPAYYEETDLCFALRKKGYKVVYNPKAAVIHHESVTAGKDAPSHFKKYLEINREKFTEKWKDELSHQDEHPHRTGELPKTASRERLSKPAAAPKAGAGPFESKKKKGLVFFPQNPYPAKTGAHTRCLAVLQALKRLDYEVTLFSYNLSGSYPWREKSVRYLHDELGVDGMIYEDTETDRQFVGSEISINAGGVNWDVFTPPGMVENFRRLFIKLKPDITIINYAYWAGLAQEDEFNCALKVIDTHDLVTLNTRMEQLAGAYLKDPPYSPQNVDSSLLEEHFYRKRGLEVAPEEYQIYDLFDYTIAVSKLETRAIREHTSYTRAVNIPITSPVVEVTNSYGGAPVFVMGDNPFNIQGYLFFVAKILPVVKSRLAGFQVNVSGEATRKLLPAEGIQLLGYVPDLTPLYADAMFAICPVMGGTGMPVKVIEAMAHGLPVIAMRSTGQEIPIEHGETGFIAEDAAEFADYILRLHSDRALCHKMGQAARNAIAQHFSEQVLLQKLSEITQGHPNVYRPKLGPAIRMNGLTKKLEDREQHIKNLEYILQDKETHIRNLDRQREENYRGWQAHTKNLESILHDKQTHIENLDRQQEENYRNWQAHTKNLESILDDKQAHTKNLESILQDKQTHIENLERQREENYGDWQAQLKALNEVIQEKEQENQHLKTSLDERSRQIELLEHPKGFREKAIRIRKIIISKEP